MKIVNLTKHGVAIHDENGNLVMTVPPSGTEARIEVTRDVVGRVLGIPIYETRPTGFPVGLPDPQPDTIYIVSGLFRQHFDRDDLYQPGELIRDDRGQPVGCIGLSR